MPTDQVIAVDFIDLLGQKLSIRIVGRNVHMRGARSYIPE
jgi:hypothetical protein